MKSCYFISRKFNVGIVLYGVAFKPDSNLRSGPVARMRWRIDIVKICSSCDFSNVISILGAQLGFMKAQQPWFLVKRGERSSTIVIDQTDAKKEQYFFVIS